MRCGGSYANIIPKPMLLMSIPTVLFSILVSSWNCSNEWNGLELMDGNIMQTHILVDAGPGLLRSMKTLKPLLKPDLIHLLSLASGRIPPLMTKTMSGNKAFDR